MIRDTLAHAKQYSPIASGLDTAFQFLAETDLEKLATGTYELKGKDVFAIVMEYETKPEEKCIRESHYKYIDVHYIISGAEGVGVTTLKTQQPYEADKEKDYAFYDCDVAILPLQAGNFVVLFPQDVHCTGVQLGKSITLKKVVIKVRVQ
ncbi:MAG TPA: DUF386 domain-containing protein [Flavobacteriaceae bacterium]|jgi:YhcH/YjgK/YiaL family protein|nr:YhcH/YjgK/YiaL family protein [Flavobacteriaceae bacterium]HBR52799.1 YhcH/YjgK/YiaL family protein [Flavobacteriaceae bacterium]HIB48653.1 DUF386 domain-containing protein [Flavobacteriaceae bacterium]HIO00262.1 DUF386 domain-containing protein [Flavobacteriaceae bacterium]|tara:strand:- start:663 stop:1112 length:450 start_codon:yes stop_codon:yes gene_type:complete